MPDPSKPTGPFNEPASLDSLFDWMSMGCMHGVGHGGFVHAAMEAQGGTFDACGSSLATDAETTINSWSVCATAPSEALRYMCAGGYYHAVFEHFDHVVGGKDWMWPCNEPGLLPYPEKCFFWMNYVLGMTDVLYDPAYGPQMGSVKGKVAYVWLARRRIFDAFNGPPSSFCSSKHESVTLACLDSLAAYASTLAPFGWLFRRKFDLMTYNLVKVRGGRDCARDEIGRAVCWLAKGRF